MPQSCALPMPPAVFCRDEPLDEQDASYFAASERIFSFSSISIKNTSANICLLLLYHIKNMFVNIKRRNVENMFYFVSLYDIYFNKLNYFGNLILKTYY